MNSTASIEHILADMHTIAVVGLSSNSGRAGYYVPAYLQEHGYRIIPVNPFLDKALGVQAYPDLISVPEPVELALIFRQPQHVPPVVEQAIQIGVKAVWMQLGIAHEQAANRAESAGLLVVQNACIMVEHRKWLRSSREGLVS